MQRKELLLTIRVTKEQKRMFERAARRVGLDVSNWIRSISVQEARRLTTEAVR